MHANPRGLLFVGAACRREACVRSLRSDGYGLVPSILLDPEKRRWERGLMGSPVSRGFLTPHYYGV
jgi:hypothetical protein